MLCINNYIHVTIVIDVFYHNSIKHSLVRIRGFVEEYTWTECGSTQHPDKVRSGTRK